MNALPPDNSNGYELIAEAFIRARSPSIGAATVREWSKELQPGSSILDLGCGHGVPISQSLINKGFTVHGIDASPSLIAAFRQRFPKARAECQAVEHSKFFGRKYDGVIAWGLMFLLAPAIQPIVISKAARALKPGGKFLFTSPRKALKWSDALTGRESVSLGAEVYEQILSAEGFTLAGEKLDEGDNHYYFASKP